MFSGRSLISSPAFKGNFGKLVALVPSFLVYFFVVCPLSTCHESELGSVSLEDEFGPYLLTNLVSRSMGTRGNFVFLFSIVFPGPGTVSTVAQISVSVVWDPSRNMISSAFLIEI